MDFRDSGFVFGGLEIVIGASPFRVGGLLLPLVVLKRGLGVRGTWDGVSGFGFGSDRW